MTAPARRPTIKDVARGAGVSFQTVSRAINGKAEIDPETRRRVLEVARRIGYRPSRHARALVAPAVDTIGVIVPDMVNPFYPALIQGLIDAAAAHDWRVVVTTSDGRPEAEARLVTAMSGQVDALIGYFNQNGPLTSGDHDDIALVRLDLEGPVLAGGGVRIEVEAGVSAAVDHLIQRGSRRPVMIDCSSTCDRVLRRESFLASTARHGLDVGEDRVVMAEQTVAGGEAAAAVLLDRHPDVDAFFAFNDLVAVGALRALQVRGLQIPDDCAVVGFDGIPLGELVTPSLTSVRLDTHRLGVLAVDQAARLLAGHGDVEPAALSCELIVRDSS
jgi:LacI family transcriptional regulator